MQAWRCGVWWYQLHNYCMRWEIPVIFSAVTGNVICNSSFDRFFCNWYLAIWRTFCWNKTLSLRQWFDAGSSAAASAPVSALRSAHLCMGIIWGTDLDQKKYPTPASKANFFSWDLCWLYEWLKKNQHVAGRAKGLAPSTWRGKEASSWGDSADVNLPTAQLQCNCVYLHHCCSDSCLCLIHQI